MFDKTKIKRGLFFKTVPALDSKSFFEIKSPKQRLSRLYPELPPENRKTGISTPNSSEQFFDPRFLDAVSPVPVFLEEGSDDESVGQPEIRNVARIDPGTDENRNPVVGRIAVSVADGIKDLQSFNCKPLTLWAAVVAQW